MTCTSHRLKTAYQQTSDSLLVSLTDGSVQDPVETAVKRSDRSSDVYQVSDIRLRIADKLHSTTEFVRKPKYYEGANDYRCQTQSLELGFPQLSINQSLSLQTYIR